MDINKFKAKSKTHWYNLKTDKWVKKGKISSLADLHNYPSSYEDWIEAGKPFPVDKLNFRKRV